jgi:hypothetical protein
MKDKFINFQEKNNKPIFEIECMMDEMIDEVLFQLRDFFLQNNIFHPITLNINLDHHMDKLKKYKYIEGDTLETGEYYCMFDKQTIAFKSGKFIEKQDDFIILQSKVNRYHLSSDDHYIFQRVKKTKDDKLRDLLNLLVNGKFKIKKKQ